MNREAEREKRKAELYNRRASIIASIDSNRVNYAIGRIVAVILFTFCPLLAYEGYNRHDGWQVWEIALSSFLFMNALLVTLLPQSLNRFIALMPRVSRDISKGSWQLDISARNADGRSSSLSYLQLETLLRDVEDQLELIDYEATDRDLRAERQFRLHQLELKRYYDQTLAQSMWVFYLGVFCLVVGMSIIVVCAVIVYRLDPKQADAKIIVGILGAIGSILTNYIAAVYLKMHAGTIQSLTQFHNRLVGTNRLHYAYLLASKIDADAPSDKPKLLDKTLSMMALQVASPCGIAPKEEAPKEANSTKPKNRLKKEAVPSKSGEAQTLTDRETDNHSKPRGEDAEWPKEEAAGDESEDDEDDNGASDTKD